MIYAIAISGTILAGSLHPSWDSCWDTIHKYGIQDLATCEPIGERETLAPETSPRPKARK